MNRKLEELAPEETSDQIVKIPEGEQKFPNPGLLYYYKQLDDRILWIDDEIDSSTLEVARLILLWNKEDKGIPVEERKPIKLLIFSYGGEAQACFSILDAIALSKTPVWTINMGAAMSAALLILLAGHKRYCLEKSTALIHSGSGSTSGTYEQTQAQQKDYDHFIKVVREFILAKTNITKQLFDKHRREEWYLYSEDQVKLGIVDEVLTDIDLLY